MEEPNPSKSPLCSIHLPPMHRQINGVQQVLFPKIIKIPRLQMDVRMSMGFFSMHVAGRALLSFSSLQMLQDPEVPGGRARFCSYTGESGSTASLKLS